MTAPRSQENNEMKKLLQQLLSLQAKVWVVVLAGLLFAIAGFLIGSRPKGGGAEEHDVSAHAGAKQKYVCSMNISFHPYYSSYDPDDKCGFCGMDLIPAPSDQGQLGERQLTMSEAAMKLAEVQTLPAERRFVDVEIPLTGKVDYDETRVKTISAWVAGRLERLFVDYTGVPVKEGDHLVEIYSPELYTAQEELLQAMKAAAALQENSSEYIKKNTSDTVQAVREKLILLGLKQAQIDQIAKAGKPTARIEITAPIGGIVIHKNAKEGMYVKTGTPIYTVADLSKLWVKLDAYESDIAWIKYGQSVVIRTESFGDKTFKGWISFIDPILSPETRTVSVRVLVDNPDGLLRPNMFVRATVKARVGQNGAVLTSNLDGKWICPMHPEIVTDKAGPCSICGMELMKAETLGYTAKQSNKAPIILPSSAVLITGKRALVYVRLKGKVQPTFEGREVTLGPRAGNFYIIQSGIHEGEDVVVNGNFKLDSALQLVAKPSMMSPGGGVAPPAHHGGHSMPAAIKEVKANKVDESFRHAISDVLRGYYGVQKALVGDNAATSASAAKELAKVTATVKVDGLSAVNKKAWQEQAALIKNSTEVMSSTQKLQEQRQSLPLLTAAVEALVNDFGPLPDLTVRKAFCPMAFDNKGAFWLQEGETIENPYFGAAMLNCGVIKSLLSEPKNDGASHDGH